MAGIFVEIESDIKKLKQLKAEIDAVKKSLKQINIKVDIDIAKGMEVQLKSLIGQYDELVRKIGEAEGKIMLSSQRINKSAETVIKAQEQITKSASGQGTANVQGASGGNSAAETAQTASVQAQAKAYDELAAEINKILGTREANIKRMLEEQNAIRLINEEIKKLQKMQGTSSSSAVQNRIAQLNDSLLTHKAALTEVRQALSNNAKLDNTAATSMNALSQSLSRMRIAYRELTEEERSSPFGQELLASIQQADAKIKQLDASIGNHQRNVGNYASGWNGLNMSIQQIGRELPSLAMGWNTFFLAISNNLPILTDEIKRAKDEYNNLKKSGREATPVWKQVVSSLISWQTALTVGITLLTLYGDELINWVSGLFGADSAQKKLNESIKEFNQTLQQGQTEARLLFDAVKRTEEGTQGRAEAIRRINEEYGKYLPNLLSERSSLNDLEDAYRTVTEAIKENVAAKMQSQAIEEIAGESIKKQADALTKMRDISRGILGKDKGSSAMDIVQSLTEDFRKAGYSIEETWRGVSAKLQYDFGARTLPGSFYETLEDYVKSVYNSNKEIEAIQERYNPFFNKEKADEAIIQNKTYWEEVKRQAQSVLDSIESSTLKKLTEGNITGIPEEIAQKYKQAQEDIQKANKELSAYGSSSGQNEQYNAILTQPSRIDELEQRQAQERIRQQIDLENQVEQARIDAMADGSEKVLAQRNLDNKKELEAIERQKEEYKQKVIQMQKEVFDAQEELKAKQNPYYKKKSFDSSSVSVDTSMFDTIYGFTQEKQSNERLQKEREAMNSYLQEYGTYQQKKYAINEKYTRLIENATTKGEKLSLGKEWDKELTDLEIKAGNTSNAIIALFGDMSDKSLKELEDLATNGQNALEFIKNGQWDATTGARLGITEEEFKRWQESPELIKQAGDALKEVKGQADVLQPSFVKVKQGIEQFFNAGNDSKKLQESLSLINEGVNEIMSSVGFLSDTFSNLGDSFGGVFSGIAEGMNVAMDAVNSAMQGAQAGAMLGPIGAAAGGAIGLVSSLAGAIAKIHDKKNEKRIQKLQDQIDTLDKSYDKLGRSIEKAYSTDASKLIEDQNKVLEQQKILIQQQIAEEEDKKKTDNDRIKEWQQQIDEIDQALEDNKEKAEDVIFGEDIQSAIENFASAYAEAWANGEDRAESAKETVKKMMQQMVTESIKAAIKSSKRMEEIRQKLKEFYADNVLTGWEQDYIYGLAEKLQHELDSQFGWADDLFKTDDVQEQSATSRGFQTMSQDTADELNGRFTALYESNLRLETTGTQQTIAITELKGSIAGLVSQAQGVYNIADNVRDILADSYLELVQISENTGEIIKPIKQMQLDIAEVKRNTSKL